MGRSSRRTPDPFCEKCAIGPIRDPSGRPKLACESGPRGRSHVSAARRSTHRVGVLRSPGRFPCRCHLTSQEMCRWADAPPSARPAGCLGRSETGPSPPLGPVPGLLSGRVAHHPTPVAARSSRRTTTGLTAQPPPPSRSSSPTLARDFGTCLTCNRSRKSEGCRYSSG